MGISEEIKQEKFKDSYQKAAINLFYTNNWLAEKVRLFLGEADLTMQQFNVLRILRGSKSTPLSTLQIRERMLDKMSDTSRIVDRLVKKQLAEKKTCQRDKRLVDIVITTKGLQILEQLDQKEGELYKQMNNLSEAEAELLNDLLDKIRTNSDK